MSPLEPFGVLLRRHRLQRGLTLEGLAQKSLVSDRAISNLERGLSRGPHRSTVRALVAALGLDEPDSTKLHEAAAAGRPRARGPASSFLRLPPPDAQFTGRTREFAVLTDVLAPRARAGATTVVVCGAPGIGKSSLALAAAHQLDARFGGGSLFLDLRGLEQGCLSSERALRALLLALGVRGQSLSADLPDRVAIYRGLLRDMQVLLVLDNAANEQQVRNLLPAPGSAASAIVTSRRTLSGISATRRLRLDPLSRVDAVAVLHRILGSHNVPDPENLPRIARLCGDLPLALRLIGNRLSSRPGWTAAELAAGLTDEQRRLDLLRAGDASIAAAFEPSFRQLSSAAQRAFVLLSTASGRDLALSEAAALLGEKATAAYDGVDELVEAGLLHSRSFDRVGFHELVRLFAAHKLAATNS